MVCSCPWSRYQLPVITPARHYSGDKMASGIQVKQTASFQFREEISERLDGKIEQREAFVHGVPIKSIPHAKTPRKTPLREQKIQLRQRNVKSLPPEAVNQHDRHGSKAVFTQSINRDGRGNGGSGGYQTLLIDDRSVKSDAPPLATFDEALRQCAREIFAIFHSDALEKMEKLAQCKADFLDNISMIGIKQEPVSLEYAISILTEISAETQPTRDAPPSSTNLIRASTRKERSSTTQTASATTMVETFPSRLSSASALKVPSALTSPSHVYGTTNNANSSGLLLLPIMVTQLGMVRTEAGALRAAGIARSKAKLYRGLRTRTMPVAPDMP